MNNKQFIAMIVLILTLGIVVFGPTLSTLKKRLLINKELSIELVKLDKKLMILKGIDKNLIAERVKKMESVFPSDKPIVQLLSTLSLLASKHNLNFGGVSLNPGLLTSEKKNEVKNLSSLDFGFEVEGDFGKILIFLRELENAAPLMKVDKMGLEIKTSPLFDNVNILVLAKIRVSAYYKQSPETIGNINDPVKLLSRNDEAVLSRLLNFTQFEMILPVAQTGKQNLFDLGQ